ncbi:F-box domain-containing protein [Mycena sanguinolenta]|uniref:F-box domain-containing protein n=1 Tax=Mycena sanguinolenta TaxID=230812 RepID=A0A8H7CQG3_9AGAR|nr:F-box domain-containing protein [Mycena sanguinolenta]
MERPRLPVEILCQVLCLLELADLLKCGTVNRYFRSLIRESSRLQFTLELAKHRMLSLLPHSEFPPFSTRLKLIRERERNWRSPQHWAPLHKLPLPPTGTVYEFTGGFYANGLEDESKITSGISFFELPSSEPPGPDAPPLRTWTHAMGGIKIVDFTMDPAQDLLVLVALAPPQCESVYQIHLRSFDTNEPHPESSLPMGVLPCLPKVSDHLVPLETTGAVRVQVAGDLVALLVKEVHDSVSAHLQIFNWRHGGYHSCGMARMAGIEDFTFLSDSSFLIVRPSGRFECYTFENPISSSTIPELVSSYSLPPLSDGFMYWYICMSSNPAPGYVPRKESTDNRVYYPRPDERILACCLYIFKPTGPGDHHVYSFVFFLNIKMFLDATKTRAEPTTRIRQKIGLSSPIFSNSMDAASTGLLPSSPSQSQPLTDFSLVPDHFPHPYQLFSPHPSFFTPVNIQQQPPFPPPPTQAAISRARQMHLRSLATASGVQTVPWDEWGPQNTRWFDERLSTDWQHALYGLKTIECIDPSDLQRPVPTTVGEAGAPLDDAEYDNPDPAPVNPQTLPTVSHLLNGVAFDVVDDERVDIPGFRRGPVQRSLRIRDYNPYSLRLLPEETASGSDENGVDEGVNGKGKGKGMVTECEPKWTRRIVTTPSRTPSRGVFVKDIISSLPYSEVISTEKFDVTDVMMDHRRVLLMQRGKAGKLKGIDVLTM